MNKLGIIVPYRNRNDQLKTFTRHLTKYFNGKDINYEIIIVNQDNGKLFNRGMLLNIGFKTAIQLKCDYVVFHDVDMLPMNVDYSFSEIPIHMATDFTNQNEKNIFFDEYFGGITMFPVEDFIKINGYSNKYWGWGFEDDDLLLRCNKKGILLDDIKVKNTGKEGINLKFNGIDAYVKGKNNFDFNKDTTIFISFYPKNIICDPKKESDIYTIFSVPGYDFSISYNSFSRYTFCTFDDEKNVIYVNSNIQKNHRTNIIITINSEDKKIKVYQDGEFIGETIKPEKLYPYEKEEFFYIGVGNPNREGDPNFFRGYFDKLAVYNRVFTSDEVKNPFQLTKDLLLLYDSNRIENYELIDLSGNNNNGEIKNCEIINLLFDDYKTIKIPFRRKSLFTLLSHEENGFFNNKWKDQSTRWNQLRFYNEVSTNDELLENDGLSDLIYVEHGKDRIKKITQINVGL